ncbi:MAG: L-histidine N(alpha)-methyltransferase, partial [Fimbriiglobus sp.]
MTLKEAVFRMVAEKRVTADQALDLLRRLPSAPPPADGIAVIGMAARYADADGLDAVWDVLATGRECFRDAPNDRWPDAPPVAVRGGFLTNADHFDPAFFRLSVTEAALTDPQHRVFLEQAFHALEHAGYAPGELSGSRCGVFVGSGAGDYAQRLSRAGIGPEPAALIGNVPSILAARLAYFLNLKGPAVAVDTACSSSLVALHLACESLRSGACDFAVAGGVTVVSTPNLFAALTKAGMISPSNRCRAFGAGADGFVCGEGAGAVVLKPLTKAIADGDTVYGVIRASGFNQDGRTNGITAPSAPAQTDLEADVWRRAGIDPATIAYVEAHGTGTELGDPIEVEALTAAFRQFTGNRGFCRLGSAKPNFGHALAAAGVLGLVKVLLSLHHRRLPPTLFADPPSPHVDLSNSALKLHTAAEMWEPAPGKPRRAAVSSFGFSGTNAHLVVEDAPAGSPVPRRSPKPRTIFKRVDCSPDVLASRTVSASPPRERAVDPGELADRATGFAALEAYGRDLLAAAFAEMGLAAAQSAFTTAGLRRRLGVVEKYHGLFDALLGELETHGVISRIDGIFRGIPYPTPSGDRAGLLARFPDFAPLVEFLEACVRSYPRTLTGKIAATEVLFPGGSMRLVEGVYRQNALADHFNRLLAERVRAAVEAVPGTGPVRVLEVGAGTGSATARVLPAIAALGRPVEYVYTDVSVGFLQHGKQQFAQEFPFVRFQGFDLNRDPDDQGLPPGGFDVVLASNVVHATDDIGLSLGRLWRLARPGGAVVLNEVTAVQTFATLTFGLTDGWWAFRDGHARLPNAPLLDVPRWSAALAAAGFPTAEATGLLGETDPTRFAQAVIVACRDARPVPESRAVPVAAPPPAVAVTADSHGGVEDAVA